VSSAQELGIANADQEKLPGYILKGKISGVADTRKKITPTGNRYCPIKDEISNRKDLPALCRNFYAFSSHSLSY
jgi:hypothetical protein